jgi:hypothetical protein
MNTTIRTARGVIALYMRLFGFAGWASFWRTVYLLPGHENNLQLIRHEMCHLAQIERDGRVMFTIKYLWWLLRFGYWSNPYEREARAAEL